MTAGLQTRITELAYSLRESDPKLSAWILRMQATRKPKSKRAEQRAWVGRKTKGRAFKVPSKMIEEGEET
jgi:hypothetical protein